MEGADQTPFTGLKSVQFLVLLALYCAIKERGALDSKCLYLGICFLLFFIGTYC